MNPYQILESILEALADGRQEGESIADYKKRKADELGQRFAGQVRQAHQEEKAAAKQAKQAKVEYEQNPSSETGQYMVGTAIKALDKSLKASDIERKEDKLKRLKSKMNNESLEVCEDIGSAIKKKYGVNKEGYLEGRGLELSKKAGMSQYQEHKEASKRNSDGSEESYDKEFKDLLVKRERNKNLDGEQKTLKRQFKDIKDVTKDDGEFKDDLAPTKKDWEKRRELKKNESLEVSEDINSAIDKKYPEGSAKNKELKDKAAQSQRDADDAAAEHELGKRPEGEKVSGGWDIRDLHIPVETPEQVEYDRKAVDRDIKNLKKQWTKNKVGDYETKNKQFPKSYKDVGVLGEPDKKELETEKAARKALGKRKAKMNKNEALELMEEIINEVSVKRWKEAAANSLDARKEAAQNTAKYAEQSWDTYEEGSRKHPEEEDALYRRAWRDDIIAKKAEEKEDHAHDVLSVKAKGKSANKAIKAARASQDKRDKEYMQNSDPEKFNKLRVRTIKADQLVSADPVKSRNEGLEESLHDQLEKKRIEAEHTPLSDNDGYVKKYKEYAKLDKAYGDAHGRELEQAIEREGGGNFTARGSWNVQHKRGTTKNELGDIKTRQRRVNSKQIKKSIFRHNTKDVGKSVEPTVKDSYRHKTMLGYSDPYGFGTKNDKGKVNASIARHNRKVKKMDEALEIMEQIVDFADNLFELDYEEKQNISPNKISRVKKDKNGEKVEVVSVADELFPYSGSAKEQFNQKVLAKINDMIEGTGSLEDLIQFVRRGVAAKKNANEGYEKAEDILEDLYNAIKKKHGEPEYKGAASEPANKSAELLHKRDEAKAKEKEQAKEKVHEAKDPKGYKENMDIANHYDHLYSKEPANSPDGSPNPVAAEYKRKYQEYFDKTMKCHYGEGKKVAEAYDEIIGFLSDLLAEAKDPVYSNPISRELRGEKAIRDQHSDDVVKYVDRADKATGYRKQVNLERAADADKAAREASKKFRQHKGEVLDYFRKKGDNNVEAHKKLSRMMGAYEALDIIESIIKEIISEEENWEPAKYKNKWHVYDKTSCTYSAVKGGKKGAEKKAKELNTAYPEQKAKVDPFYEALDTIKEIKNVAEGLFKKDERGDLLDDIDTALGSPVKKTVKDIEDRMTGAKQKKVSENLNDQIGKKLEKGEISLDKAFELDKKVEDNMSKEKNAQEYADELDKRAKKERLGDKAVAKSIRRNEKK